MKKQHNLLTVILFAIVGLCFVSCKKEQITLSAYELWFPGDVGSVQEISISANCDWTISIDDDAEWYTIRKTYDKTVMTENGPVTLTLIDTTQVLTGGRSGDMTIAVLADPMDDRSDRSSSFTITSSKGKVQVKVSVLQNTTDLVELTDISNMAFGVSNVAHWNVDFWGDVIPDSYKYMEFNPYDTAAGFVMYFYDDGTGIQKDNVSTDSTNWWPFTYDYDAVSRNLHIEFETWADSLTEIYDAPVLVATENLFRFMQEFKQHSWERADMKKIGEAHKPEAKEMFKRANKKRKGGNGIFQF